MIDLEGKRALVTGGARGIGAAIAVALAENGADVAFTYQQSTEKAEAVAKFIADKGRRAIAIQADSANPQAIECAVAQAISTLGGLDILVNSAAIGLNGMIADIDVDDYQALMDINVRGPVLFAKAVIPHLPAGGRIITIGSGLAERVPFAGVTAYAMSKSALLAFTRGLSRELGPTGITVNLVQPGSVDTDANPAFGPAGDFQRSLSSLGRFGEPREVASAVVYLASPAASLITGAILTVDGGAIA
ncbi:SDR family oxidoreductase [Pseudomonas moraviensis]|jgi:NAD(P)-dependent dehydrogenase (short-subunit alcohol dehydrogenase family)|uniref:3-ketoacyl-ACP reductase n=1 Tax=Pseudomonas atacamensis TaxID=2565368 RepID=A0ABQ5PHA2_9PSED|nr:MULTISPECIES: SDR family oxidoreductase [Pseudomonas]MDT6921884.1 SDR family oxidoreductase [Pseudomonas atacamensis]MEB2855820.1 SDR family oxidoreductase [Pseudomonas atacamensis]MXI49645.1 SDR family oxidoreductase [Pseudomonas moraviensis]UVK91288.1 SDR family oxidoreductase [Pseudomonas atacamensis]UVL97212.1 SDR family oxidoreductase [Pseudomonas atacamensis]